MSAEIKIRRGRVYRLSGARVAVNSVTVAEAGGAPRARVVIAPADGDEYELALAAGGRLALGSDVWTVQRIEGAGTPDHVVCLARQAPSTEGSG